MSGTKVVFAAVDVDRPEGTELGGLCNPSPGPRFPVRALGQQHATTMDRRCRVPHCAGPSPMPWVWATLPLCSGALRQGLVGTNREPGSVCRRVNFGLTPRVERRMV